MATMTNCEVKRNGEDVITTPTSAEVIDDHKPTVNIRVTGGTRVADRLKKGFGSYKIKGTVANEERNYTLKCDDAGDPAKFKLP
jgi:hypothetical protein